MKARATTPCERCGEDIEPGQEMKPRGEGLFAHGVCPGDDDE